MNTTFTRRGFLGLGAAAGAGLFLAGAAVASGVAAYRGSPRMVAWLSLRRQRREYLPLHTAAQAEHSVLLERWRRYELDPAFCIDYPAMTDVRLPQTAAVIKAKGMEPAAP